MEIGIYITFFDFIYNINKKIITIDKLIWEVFIINRYRVKVLKTTPKIPDLPLNFYQKINDLEKILYDLYWVYENESLAFARNDEKFKSELYSNDNITVI